MTTSNQATARTVHTLRLNDHERQMLQFAQATALTPGEHRELMWYLDVSELPPPTERVLVAVERILGDRAANAQLPDPATVTDRCTCVCDCANDRATRCSLSGEWHVHPDDPDFPGTFGPCPDHPDAPGDV